MMDEDLLETALYSGITVDLRFIQTKPNLDDLLILCGLDHRHSSPSNRSAFEALAALRFGQVDDYFGVTSLEDDGDDVVVWLSPLIGNETVYHDSGPFDGLRLSYSVLRNPVKKASFFIQAVSDFAARLPVEVYYRLRETNLGVSPDLSPIESDINEVIAHWRSKGIEPGSDEAMMVNF